MPVFYFDLFGELRMGLSLEHEKKEVRGFPATELAPGQIGVIVDADQNRRNLIGCVIIGIYHGFVYYTPNGQSCTLQNVEQTNLRCELLEAGTKLVVSQPGD